MREEEKKLMDDFVARMESWDTGKKFSMHKKECVRESGNWG